MKTTQAEPYWVEVKHVGRKVVDVEAYLALKKQAEELVGAMKKARDFCDNNDRHEIKQTAREACAYATLVLALRAWAEVTK